jgi:3-methylcrotonyl-CoA carboxylase alpha subunit
MRYEVEVGGRRMRLETSPEGRLTVDDSVIAYDARDLGHGRVWSIVVEGHAHEVVLLGGDPQRAQVDGRVVTLALADERAAAARADRSQVAGGRHEVRAPMPGLLKAVHVAQGDVVERGAALATLEAMKMENELRAPSRGRVQRLTAAPGTKVESGALIAVLIDEPA